MQRSKVTIIFIILAHVIAGVPLAALFHSILQFAYETSFVFEDIFLFPLHFFLGILFGSVILIPAYFLQSLLYLLLRKIGMRCAWLVFICGVFQAFLISLWALFVGIQPSLGGRFPLTPPMIFAGFVVGAFTAGLSCLIVTIRSKLDQNMSASNAKHPGT